MMQFLLQIQRYIFLSKIENFLEETVFYASNNFSPHVATPFHSLRRQFISYEGFIPL